jgi:malonyl-CoA O-methyltransferase
MIGNPVNPFLVRKAYNQVANGYERNAVLQVEVENRLMERLDVVRLAPGLVIDLGCGTARSTAALKRRYRKARIVGVDFARLMLREGRKNSSMLRPIERCCADICQLPFADRTADLLFSNLAVHWANDPAALFTELRRILKPGGVLMFSSFGPDTLTELRQSWAAADGKAHVNDFLDMHDIGDALLQAGFCEPVMDAENIALTYPSVSQLMQELKATGSHNVTAARRHSLTGRNRIKSMTEAYEAFKDGDRYPATFEVVYGVAWGPAEGQPQRLGDGEVATFSVDHLRGNREQD